MKKLAMITATILVVAITAACSSQKAPAEMAAKAVDDAMATAGPEVETYAPEAMSALTSGMDAMKAKLADSDYEGVLTDASAMTSQIASAAQAAAATKTELTAEWASFATLPAMVAQVTTKVSELSSARRLPRGMTKETLDGAKASLESVNTAWAEATAAQEKGDLIAAVAKAKDVKPMVESLMSTLDVSMPTM